MDNNSNDFKKSTTVDNELQYSCFFESGIDGMLLVNPASGKVIAANPAACEILKSTKNEIINLENYSFFDHSDPKTPIFLEELRRNRKVKAEIKFVHNDGSTFQGEVFSLCYKGDNGEERNCITFRDISERKNAEHEKQMSAHNYQSLINTVDGIVWEADANTLQFSFVSEQAERLFGYPLQQWINEPDFWKNHIHAEDKDTAIAYCIKYTQEKKPYQFEYRMINKNGMTIWVQNVVSVIVEEDIPILLRGVMTNISKRKEAEQNLANEELRYRRFFEQNLAGVYQTTTKGFILNCNDAFARMLRYDSTEQLINTNASKLYFSNDDRQKFITHLRNEKKLYNYELVLKCRDGSPLYVIENIFFHTDPVSGEEYCDGVMIDISERRLAELQMEETNLKYQAIINNSMIAFVLTDDSGDILEANNSACEMFGYQKQEFIKLNQAAILEGNNTKFIKEADDQEKTGMAEVEIYGLKKNGERFAAEFISSVFLNAKGEQRISTLLTDISERKKLEEKVVLEKILKQKELTEAVIAAHESERSEIGRELHDNVTQLLGTALLFTKMAKNDSQNIELLNNSSIYTTSAIEEIRKLSKTLITPLIKNIGLKDSIKDVIEDIMVADPIKIIFNSKGFSEENLNEKFKLNVFRIVQEQINNALTHAKANVIKIDFKEIDDHLIISVTDDGVGFDTTTRKKGVGISNIISRAELYKGDVKINSSPGKGCNVAIDFIKSDLLLN